MKKVRCIDCRFGQNKTYCDLGLINSTITGHWRICHRFETCYCYENRLTERIVDNWYFDGHYLHVRFTNEATWHEKNLVSKILYKQVDPNHNLSRKLSIKSSRAAKYEYEGGWDDIPF